MDCARRYIEFGDALSRRIIRSREGRTASNTTGTTFEQYASELAAKGALA